ncbi:MAG TPA: hypothetical protein VFL63_01790 [Rhodanobacteraceae bacterium]|nr:hypothetical protein [Rhodanobacteraceae bacterium]
MSDQSVESRAAKVSLVTGGSVIIAIVFQLVSVPICLHFWGARQYGEWLAVFAAANFLRVVDSGYITFAGNRLNLLYHQDTNLLRKVLASGVYAVALLGVVQIGALLLIGQLGGLGWLLGSDHLARASDAQAALAILVGSWVVSGSYFGLVHRLMVPTGLLYQAAWWSMGYQVSLFLAVVCAAASRFDLLATSILVAAIQAVTYILSAAYVWWKLPEFMPWRSRPSLHLALLDIRGSLVFSAQSAAQQLSTNGLVVLVSSMLGTAIVPVFTTTRTAVNLWNSVINTLTSPLLPDVVRLHVQKQTRKLLALADAHVWLIGTIVSLGIVVSYPVVVWAYGIWTHHELVLDKPLLAALLASMAFVGAGSFMTLYLAGINNRKAVLVLALTRATISFAVALILLRPLGLVGVGFGLLAAEAVCYLLMATHFFPQATQMRAEVSRRIATPGWLPWSVIIACAYVGIAAHFGRTLPIYYAISIALTLTAAWFGWKALDTDTRARLVALGLRFSPIGGSK